MAQRWRCCEQVLSSPLSNTGLKSSPGQAVFCTEKVIFFVYQMEIICESMYFIQHGMEGSSWTTAKAEEKYQKKTSKQASTKLLCDEKGQWRSYQNKVHKFNPLKGQIQSVIKAEKMHCYQKFPQWLKWSFDRDSNYTNKHKHNLTEQRSHRGQHVRSNACQFTPSHLTPGPSRVTGISPVSTRAKGRKLPPILQSEH